LIIIGRGGKGTESRLEEEIDLRAGMKRGEEVVV
jgi:hypothetical protein